LRVEGKYELGPGVYCALRYGRIDYGYIDDGQAAWDYGIQRIETGFGYYLDRRTRLKVLVQLNNGPARPTRAIILSVCNWPAFFVAALFPLARAPGSCGPGAELRCADGDIARHGRYSPRCITTPLGLSKASTQRWHHSL